MGFSNIAKHKYSWTLNRIGCVYLKVNRWYLNKIRRKKKYLNIMYQIKCIIKRCYLLHKLIDVNILQSIAKDSCSRIAIFSSSLPWLIKRFDTHQLLVPTNWLVEFLALLVPLFTRPTIWTLRWQSK